MAAISQSARLAGYILMQMSGSCRDEFEYTVVFRDHARIVAF